MKKITLSLLISLPLVGAMVATLALTPFHPKQDNQVEVVLSSDVMAQSGRPIQAWSGLQTQFNKTLTEQNLKLPKIRIFWDNKDILTKTISNYQLPDLYLTKPSNLPIYNASSQKKNMRSFTDYAHYYDNDLLGEYEFGNEKKLLGLPLYKSFDVGVVNTKRLKELGFDWDSEKLNSLSYQDLDAIIQAGISQGVKDPLIGFDDLPNQLYLSQNKSSKAVKAEGNTDFTFSYTTIDKYQNYNLRYNINPQIANYFESWKKSGLFTTSMIKGGVKTYTSNEFLKGKMVYTASSSAGLFAFQKNTTYNYKSDLAIVKNASLNGGDNLYYSQGIGIGGFKSVGKNRQEKEETVKLFMEWLLGNSETLSTLASNANYLPATTDGNKFFIDPKHTKPGTKYPFATDLYKTFYDQDPLSNSTFQIMNPADYIVRNTLSNIWVNIYWTTNKLTFTDAFNFNNYKKYTNFGDLFNRSKVVK